MEARNLPDTDGLFSGDSDPYTRVTALQGAGVLSTTRETRTIAMEAPKIQSGINLSVSAVESGDLLMSVCGIVIVVEMIC